MQLKKALKKFRRGNTKSDAKLKNSLKAIFDREWFSSKYAGLVEDNTDPFEFFFRHEASKGLNPNPLFDRDWYGQINQDVTQAGVSPVHHYVTRGFKEGREPGPLFDSSLYRELHPDSAGQNPLAHYLASPAKTFPHTLFDEAWYADRYQVRDKHPIYHYLSEGWRTGTDPSPMFSTLYYQHMYPDVAAAGVNPLLHYLAVGDREGRNPSPHFDSRWYLTTYPDIAASSLNALVHFVRYGLLENRSPRPD